MASFSQLGRVSHLAVFRVLPWIFMSASACLVTSSPTFEDPVQTKPFLDFEGAGPDPRQILVLSTDVSTTLFEAQLRSEDAGEPVLVRMLVDYGTCNVTGKPFQDSQQGLPVDPSTFSDTSRKAQHNATIENELTPGCHRLTLIATHEFNEATGCPADPDDFAQITWTVFVCDDNCDFDPVNCPVIEASCTDTKACEPEPVPQ